MGNKTQSGFTIIEVVLFLAVSALLLFVLMAGSANQINRQRYNDGLRSMQTYLQQQYDETLTVINGRDPNLRCDNSPQVVAATPATREPRGTSDCIVMGKAIKVNPGESVIRTYHVIGIAPPGQDPLTASSATSEAELIYAYKPTIVDNSEATYTIPWGMSISSTGSFKKESASSPHENLRIVALLRSPRNGGLVTYSYGNPDLTRLDAGDFDDTSNRIANICIENQDFAGSRALLQLGTLGTQSAVTAHTEVQGSVDPELRC